MTPFDLTVMMYHYVRDAGDEAERNTGIPGMAVSTFEAQLDFLCENYNLISWPVLREFLTHEPRPENRVYRFQRVRAC